MSKSIKKILVAGASLLMLASVGAGMNNINANASSGYYYLKHNYYSLKKGLRLYNPQTDTEDSAEEFFYYGHRGDGMFIPWHDVKYHHNIHHHHYHHPIHHHHAHKVRVHHIRKHKSHRARKHAKRHYISHKKFRKSKNNWLDNEATTMQKDRAREDKAFAETGTASSKQYKNAERIANDDTLQDWENWKDHNDSLQ